LNEINDDEEDRHLSEGREENKEDTDDSGDSKSQEEDKYQEEDKHQEEISPDKRYYGDISDEEDIEDSQQEFNNQVFGEAFNSWSEDEINFIKQLKNKELMEDPRQRLGLEEEDYEGEYEGDEEIDDYGYNNMD
jgi:hypothetical protein